MRPSRPFYVGCAVGLVVGFALPFLALLAVGTVLRKPLTPMAVSMQARHLRVPPISSGQVADYGWELLGIDGQLLNLESLRGRTLFLNFWRDDCIPCLAEIPALNALHAKLGEEVAFLTVFVGKDGDAAFAVEREGAAFPVYTAPEGWPDVFDFTATPATFVVAPSGEIAFKHIGGAKWDDPSAVAFLRGLAAQDTQ
jgi:thiol-disulfide isomerase/thioredoxin